MKRVEDGGTLKKGAVNDLVLSGVLVAGLSFVQPFAASIVGGLAAYINLHRRGEVDFSFFGLVTTVFLAVFLGWIVMHGLHWKGFDEEIIDPATGFAGFMSPKILNLLYDLDLKKLFSKWVK